MIDDKAEDGNTYPLVGWLLVCLSTATAAARITGPAERYGVHLAV